MIVERAPINSIDIIYPKFYAVQDGFQRLEESDGA